MKGDFDLENEFEKKIFDANFEVKEIKKENPEIGTIIGYAATFNSVDFVKDTILPGAFLDTIAKNGKFKSGVKYCISHNPYMPIGITGRLEEDSAGLKNESKIALNTSLGHDTWELIKIKAITQQSIGWELLKIDRKGNLVNRDETYFYDPQNGIRFLKKIDLIEISAVGMPADVDSNITQFKNLVENFKDIRELEHGLHENGMSKKAAMYIISLCKGIVKKEQKENEQKNLYQIFESLKAINYEAALRQVIYTAKNIK